MPKFRVVCEEDVATTFYVKAPNEERLNEWLEKNGTDIVSFLTSRQEVFKRDFHTEPCADNEDIDADTEGMV